MSIECLQNTNVNGKIKVIWLNMQYSGIYIQLTKSIRSHNM